MGQGDDAMSLVKEKRAVADPYMVYPESHPEIENSGLRRNGRKFPLDRPQEKFISKRMFTMFESW
jgi:hypothetical protein